LLTNTACGHQLRTFITTLAYLSGMRYGEWISLDDLIVAHECGAWSGSDAGARKWTQRIRKQVVVWNERTKLGLIWCQPGGRTREGVHYPSSYQLPLIAVAERITTLTLHDNSKDRPKAYQRATERVLLEYEPVAKPDFSRKRRLETPEEIINAVSGPLRRAADQKQQGHDVKVPDITILRMLRILNDLRD
jgi:hypothetical protein